MRRYVMTFVKALLVGLVTAVLTATLSLVVAVLTNFRASGGGGIGSISVGIDTGWITMVSLLGFVIGFVAMMRRGRPSTPAR
jgi:hypothetical protein